MTTSPAQTSPLPRLLSRVAADFAGCDRAHDLDHLQRVERLAVTLARREGGDETTVRAAALVHDYHRLDGAHGLQTTGGGGLAIAQATLREAGFDPDAVTRVAACVEYTDRYHAAGDQLEPPSIDASIVRDADNLDAMGAIGIARAFAFGGVLGERLWDPEQPVRERYDRGHAPSVIHHFHEKLLRLRSELETNTAREIGERRHEEMVAFVAAFTAEWDGVR